MPLWRGQLEGVTLANRGVYATSCLVLATAVYQLSKNDFKLLPPTNTWLPS